MKLTASPRLLALTALAAVPLTMTGLSLASMASLTAAGGKTLIAHRGASGYAPEHTRAAYEMAMEQGANFVEQDLAVTKDGVLVCIHDDTLERTSNVAEVFPDRFSQENLVRQPGKHWLVNDFTLEELRRLDFGRWFDGKYAGQTILTFQEAIDLVKKNGKAGIYPELKSPPLYTGRGVDMVKIFVEQVKKNGLDTPASLKSFPMIVQSFDEPTIKRLSTELPTVPRVLLMSRFDEAGMTDARLKVIKSFATGIGPEKRLIAEQPTVVAKAHAAGLTVTVWTFASKDLNGYPNVKAEMSHFLNDLGIDALFTNNPDQFPR